MSRHSTDFLLNSLKGRIWLAVSAMAALNCFGGLVAYLLASFFTSDPFYSVFITFFLSALVTTIFGWWLSNEVLGPIDKVSMLAQSLERSPAASLPRTTGATETDELLRTLHRMSQQLNNLIKIMDEVAAGKAVDALVPAQESDRLTASFQKLVGRVADSIDAKHELIALQTAVTRLSAEVAVVNSGSLNINIVTESAETRELAAAFKFLSERLSDLVRRVNTNSLHAKTYSARLQQALRLINDEEKSRAGQLNRAATALAEAPVRLDALQKEVASTLAAAEQSITGLCADSRKAAERSASLNMLRRTVSDSLKKLQKFRTHLQAIPQSGKSADEIAKRCKLIALNATLQTRQEPKASTAASFADEVGSLSIRAESINKEISATSESMLREISELETGLKIAVGGFTDLLETANVSPIDSLETSFARLLELPARIAGVSIDSAALNLKDLAPASLSSAITEAEQNLSRLIRLSEELTESTADLRVPGIEIRHRGSQVQYSDSAFDVQSHLSRDLKEN